MKRAAKSDQKLRPQPAPSAVTEPSRTPHNLLLMPPTKWVAKYGSGPAEDVTMKSTMYMDALDLAFEADPLGVRDFMVHWDHRLRPRIREAERAKSEALARLKLQIERARTYNRPIEDKIKEWSTVKDTELHSLLKTLHEVEADLAASVRENAVGHSKAVLALDELKSVPELPEAILLQSRPAHAAGLQLPHSPNEITHFLSPRTEVILSVLCGSVVGLSAFAAGSIINLRALWLTPWMNIIAVAFGISLTMLAGRAVKLAWRSAAEACYLGKPWYGQAGLAGIATAVFIGIEATVDQRGLLGAGNLHLNVGALSGKPVAADESRFVTMFLVGAFASFAYFTCCAAHGWLKDRTAAANRIEESQEKERIKLITERREVEGWSAVVESGNKVLANSMILKQAEQAYRTRVGLIQGRITELESKLMVIADRPTDEDVRIMEQAIWEAEGQQLESDRRLLALRKGRVHRPTIGRNQQGWLERASSWLGGVFRSRKTQSGGQL